jgi:hypothetical protein
MGFDVTITSGMIEGCVGTIQGPVSDLRAQWRTPVRWFAGALATTLLVTAAVLLAPRGLWIVVGLVVWLVVLPIAMGRMIRGRVQSELLVSGDPGIVVELVETEPPPEAGMDAARWSAWSLQVRVGERVLPAIVALGRRRRPPASLLGMALGVEVVVRRRDG